MGAACYHTLLAPFSGLCIFWSTPPLVPLGWGRWLLGYPSMSCRVGLVFPLLALCVVPYLPLLPFWSGLATRSGLWGGLVPFWPVGVGLCSRLAFGLAW